MIQRDTSFPESDRWARERLVDILVTWREMKDRDDETGEIVRHHGHRLAPAQDLPPGSGIFTPRESSL
ncbi:hypothetical protein SY88_10635 [Clostridiales bacterium PH28_bin88]|nr:hypothetical protein SY88_10635 [Clostridiales bacterium PH28_bin88]